MPTSSTEITRRYSLQYKLGEGGMGEVYAALDRLTGTTVALKRVLHAPKAARLGSDYGIEGSNTDLRRILANEFRVLASLRHPHIISVLDYGFDDEHFPYYTMMLLEQPRTVVEAAQHFNFAESVNAFAQMLQALAYLHRRNILHRDLKPGNVLIDEHGAVKLLDFGLATQENVHSTSGTLAYMAPEIMRNGNATPESDLYSVGMVGYELFAGHYPFKTTSANELLEQILRQMPDMDSLPEAIRPVVFRLLMKEPTDRYPDAESALSDLAEMTGGTINIEDATVRESFLQAARFVGREKELSTLTQQLDRIVRADNMGAETAGGAAFLIGGESGVGKSRLLDELRTHALLNGALVLRGQCLSETGQPFQMWRDVVRRLLLEHDISDLEAGILFEVVPDISDLMGQAVSAAPTLGATSAQTRLVDAIVGLFQRQRQPTLLIVEDLHWGMENLIPLRRLVEMCSSLPLLIVGSYRNDEVPSLPSQLPGMRTMILGRLTSTEVANLSQAMIGTSGDQKHVVEYLHQQSEGNVLFLVEVIRALAEDAGNLRSIGSKTLPEQVFAGGIDKIIARRLQRLPPAAAPTLQLAALAGRNIDENLMRWLVGANADRWLQAGMDAAILDVMDAQWRFAHDRLRDAVISMISPAEKPIYHQRIAEGLEALYPNSANLANILYEHWRAAGNSEKEAYYAVMVMEQRLRFGILNEASAMLEKALILQPSDPQLQLKFTNLAGEVYYDLGKPELSAEVFTTCLRLARRLERLDIAGNALEGLGNAAQLTGDYDAALRWYEQSLELRRHINDLPGVASALHYISVRHRLRGNYAASWDALQESLALRRTINDTRGLGDSLYQLSVHARNRGDYDEAIEYLQESLQLRRSIADGRGISDDLNNLGICYTLVGDFERARTTLVESLTFRRAIQNERGAASTLNSLGELSMVEQQYSSAIRAFGLALGIWLGKHETWNIANSHVSLGYAQAMARELYSARHHLYEGLQIAQRIAATFIVLKGLIGWAQVKHEEGDDSRAAMLLGAVEANASMTALLRQIYFDPVAAKLDRSLYAMEFALGHEMNLPELIKLTLSEADADIMW